MTSRRRLSAVPTDARHAVLYVRVSSVAGRGGDDFHSPDLQLDAMRALAARNGLLEVEVVQDIDRSGRSFAREGIDRIMQLARARQVDVVAVYDLSRFGRNTGESLRHIAELRELGVSVVSTVEQIDDSPEGQFMLGQFLGMAQLYSDQIGRRWQQVLEHRARQGRWHGSNAPLGYRVEAGRGLVVDELLGPLMTGAFERYAAGHMVSHIARDIGDRRGRTLAVGTLKRAFRNPVYVGRLLLNEVEYPAVHEPLVEAATWERVQRRLERDTRTPSRRLAVSHTLVGLVVCDHCGYHLQLHTNPGRAGALPEARLQCRQRLHGGAHVCPGPGTPPQTDVEAAVLAQLPVLIERLQAQQGQRAEKQARRVRAGVDVDRLEREIGKSETALARLTVDRARRDITQSAYQLAADDLEQTLAALRLQKEDAELVAESPSPRAFVSQAKALLQLWHQVGPDGRPVMTVEEKNRGLRALLREVRVRRAGSYREPVAQRVEVVPIS